MALSNINHNIKNRKKANDIFYTPIALATECINIVPLMAGDTVLDPAYGAGAFYNNYPTNITKYKCEITQGIDFFDHTDKVDWIITNPPFSILDDWLTHTLPLCNKGFGYLIGWNNLTARRIEMANKAGFGITHLFMFKIFSWFGMSCFVIFQKDKENIITINRKVWR